MDLKQAVVAAKQQVTASCAPDTAQSMRLEEFVYDDHLGIWSLTIGFALPDRDEPRSYKIVRVSEADKSVLSIRDR
jgi:hypothetical protein